MFVHASHFVHWYHTFYATSDRPEYNEEERVDFGRDDVAATLRYNRKEDGYKITWPTLPKRSVRGDCVRATDLKRTVRQLQMGFAYIGEHHDMFAQGLHSYPSRVWFRECLVHAPWSIAQAFLSALRYPDYLRFSFHVTKEEVIIRPDRVHQAVATSPTLEDAARRLCIFPESDVERFLRMEELPSLPTDVWRHISSFLNSATQVRLCTAMHEDYHECLLRVKERAARKCRISAEECSQIVEAVAPTHNPLFVLRWLPHVWNLVTDTVRCNACWDVLLGNPTEERCTCQGTMVERAHSVVMSHEIFNK